MKIGIFDSGVGGLLVTQAIAEKLPQYDYIYLGDVARVPYGNRSSAVIYQFTKEAIDYLFKQNCQLIIVACNTASAEALRKIQQEYLPKKYPGRRVLGVLIPAAEVAAGLSQSGKIGVLATQGTVSSNAIKQEIIKLRPKAKITQVPAPLLVPLIENNGLKWIQPILQSYLKPLIEANIDTLVLGCTHYPFVKDMIRELVGPQINVVSQDEIVPAKLADYLNRHPEIESKLTRNSTQDFLVTDQTDWLNELAEKLFAQKITLRQVEI